MTNSEQSNYNRVTMQSFWTELGSLAIFLAKF